ncbi:MAG: tRNA pseudouridine38-40 synthase [Acidobacteriota bacterium]|jgi:tRNA pseudouridine38-40 synthase|nr:tRNA pseudouridine38-40 synthase [Acidobacteriota bacterium]
MNFKLTLQYDGTDFHGWQMQSDERTIQGEITRGLTLLNGSPVVVHGSGRTDAGVHAEGQVASVHLQRDITSEKLVEALNGLISRDVRIMEATTVPDDFHARYSARGKTYIYRIFNSRVLSPFWARYAVHERRVLDLPLMRRCAELFLGEHDWMAFSPIQPDPRDRVRTITNLEVSQRYDERGQGTILELTVSANGFLRYMVRCIAGTLMAAGRGELKEDAITRAINDGDRTSVGATAPPHGLTLQRVLY